MPPLRRKADPPPPIDPAEWRPQAFGKKGIRSINDPIIEPAWSGVRVIVRVGRGPDGSPAVTLTDEDGLDSTAEFADVAQAIAAAALTDELILDGYLTVEPTQDTRGLDMRAMETPTKGELLTHMLVGGRIRVPEPKRQLDPDRPIAFVAVDLLLIDGDSLVDLPLLERKRLLDTALKADYLVRITPFVRTPVGSLALTWHAQGFRELAYKPANGRYQPGGGPGDWVVVPIRSR
jgi:bifunctional non-homologous end joining protein LigD